MVISRTHVTDHLVIEKNLVHSTGTILNYITDDSFGNRIKAMTKLVLLFQSLISMEIV